VREHAEEVMQVGLGVEPVQLAGGDEREDVPGALGVVVAADEEPGLSSRRDGASAGKTSKAFREGKEFTERPFAAHVLEAFRWR